jgi:hypothetical protein
VFCWRSLTSTSSDGTCPTAVMILLDEVDREALKQRHRRPPSTSPLPRPARAFILDRPAPPAYTTLECSPRGTEKTGRHDGQLCRATLYALGIYIALSAIFGVPFLIWVRRHTFQYCGTAILKAGLPPTEDSSSFGGSTFPTCIRQLSLELPECGVPRLCCPRPVY